MGPKDSPRGGWNGSREGQFRRRQRAVTAGRRRGTGGRGGRDRRNRGRGAGDRRRGARGRGARAKACAQTGGEEAGQESGEEESRAEEKGEKIEAQKEGRQEESEKDGEEEKKALSLFQNRDPREERAGTLVPAFSFCGIAPPGVGFHRPWLLPNLNAALLDSGIELPGGAMMFAGSTEYH